MATSRRAGGGSRQLFVPRTAVSAARHPRRFRSAGTDGQRSGPRKRSRKRRGVPAMAKTIRVDGEDIEIRPMTPERAAFMREACTHLGLATYCPFRVCRRNRRCGTKDVLCYQIMRQEVNAILLPRSGSRPRRGQYARRRPDDHAGDAQRPGGGIGNHDRRPAAGHVIAATVDRNRRESVKATAGRARNSPDSLRRRSSASALPRME